MSRPACEGFLPASSSSRVSFLLLRSEVAASQSTCSRACLRLRFRGSSWGRWRTVPSSSGCPVRLLRRCFVVACGGILLSFVPILLGVLDLCWFLLGFFFLVLISSGCGVCICVRL